jgi:[acyl-carrier-protein] S-malonyltransferase
VRQVCSPVRWVESIVRLRELGCTRFLELGPGRVLCGLIRRIDKGVETLNGEDPSSFEEALARLEGQAQPAGPEGVS